MSLDREKQLMAQTDDELIDLVERLDRDAKMPKDDTRREGERFSYRAGVIPCLVFDSNGAKRKTVLYPRNISSGGIAVVHRGYLHVGTELHVVLRKREGDPVVVRGVTRSCRHVARLLHEVGVQFEEKLEPSEFCEPEIIEATLAASRRRNPLPRVDARVLFVSNSEDQLRWFRASFSSTGMDLETCDCIGAAIDDLKAGRFDIVISDDDLAEIPPEKLVPSIRAQKHEGAIVILTWTPNDEHTQTYEPDEGTRFYQRPADPRRFAAYLAAIMEGDDDAQDQPSDPPGGESAQAA